MLSQKEEGEGIESKNNRNDNDFDFDFSSIFSTASLWLTGGNRPTLYIPIELAKRYRMDKPCRVAFLNHKNGILISFICSNKNNVI